MSDRRLVVLDFSLILAVVTLQLFRPPIAYAFAVTQVLLTQIVFYSLTRGSFRPHYPLGVLIRPAELSFLPLLALASDLVMPIPEPLYGPVLLVSTTFVPGYALLAVLRLRKHFTRLEGLVTSGVLGFAYSGLVWLSLFPLVPSIRELLLIVSCLALSLITMFLGSDDHFANGSFGHPRDVPTLAALLALYVLPVLLDYPAVASVPGTDISRHYLWSQSLGPGMSFNSFVYLLPHSFEAILISSGNISYFEVLQLLAFLNLLLPVSFYAMAKAWFASYDTRAPIISTTFYAFFSGFGWIYLVRLIASAYSGTQHQLLEVTNAASYFFMTNVIQPNVLWFLPISFAFIVLMLQFTLLAKGHQSGRAIVHFNALFIVLSFFSHVPEALIFPLFLIAVSLIYDETALTAAIKGCCIGLVLSGAAFGASSWLLHVTYSSTDIRGYLIPLFAFIVAFGGTLVTKWKHSDVSRRVTASLRRFVLRTTHLVLKSLVSVLIVVYSLGVLVWIGGLVQTPPPSEILSNGSVPWFAYPILLGMTGLLSLFSVLLFHQKEWENEGTRMFLALAAFALVSAIGLSFFNSAFGHTGYWPNRLVGYLGIACAMIAPLVVLRAYSATLVTNRRTRVVFYLILSLVVFAGLQSTFAMTAYWL